MPLGKAIVESYNLANSQNWIGTSCRSDIPFLEDIYDFDKIFVYPAPLKNGELIMLPVVSWNVPPIEKLELLIGLKGLVPQNGNWEWKKMNIVQNTILFSLYLKQTKFIKMAKEGEEVRNLSPKEFPGFTPLEPTEYFINLLLEDFEIIHREQTDDH